MSRRAPQASYFADDKDIYDLLISAKKRLTVEKLSEIAFRRGIVLSLQADREALIEEISRLPFGWSELSELVLATNTAERAERTTSRRLTGNLGMAELDAAIESVKTIRGEQGEVYNIRKTSGATFVKVLYSEIDAGRTRLVQRTNRDVTFVFEAASDGELRVRHHEQPRAREILQAIVAALRKSSSVDESQVSLFGVREARLRTQFFLSFIQGLPGFTLTDVRAVKASRFDSERTDALADDIIGDEDEDEDEDEDGLDPNEAGFVAKVTEIALKGNRLLKSSEYSKLGEGGFFVCSISWISEEQNKDRRRFEFEASFGDAQNGTDFSYRIKGVHERKKDGELKKTLVQPDREEKERILRMLEDAATGALSSVVPHEGALES